MNNMNISELYKMLCRIYDIRDVEDIDSFIIDSPPLFDDMVGILPDSMFM